MTSSYRGSGPWGAGLGRPLHWSEQDENIYDKETRITSLEEGTTGGGAVGIANIESSGGQLIITMTDSSVYTFDLTQIAVEAAWTPQGAWLPSHLYHALDVVTYAGSAYLVTIDHVSDTVFDPDAVTSSAGVYSLLWTYAPLQGFESSDTTFTPELQHGNSYIRLTNSTGCNVFIDPSAVAFADWTEITFHDATNAYCTFSAVAPATINDVNGFVNQSMGNGATVTLKKVGATDAWDIMGFLQPA